MSARAVKGNGQTPGGRPAQVATSEDSDGGSEEQGGAPTDEDTEAPAGPEHVKNLIDKDDAGYHPADVPRRCTDVGWLIILILYSGLVIAVGYWAFLKGNVNELRQLYDWQGFKCGIKSKKHSPYLFFCLNDDPTLSHRSLDMYYPICVSECPLSSSVIMRCPRNLNDKRRIPYATSTKSPFFTPVTKVEHPQHAHQVRRLQSSPFGQIGASNIVLSDWRGNFTFVEESAYSSNLFVQMVCKPWKADLESQVNEWIQETPLVSTWSSIINSYQPLVITGFSAVILSYVFISLLRFRASILVWTGLTVLTLVPSALGIYLMYCWKKGEGTCPAGLGEKANLKYDLAGAIASLLVGLTFATISCTLGEQVDLAIDCIAWSCKAVLETPSLKMEPVIALTSRAVVDATALLIAGGVATARDENPFEDQNFDFGQGLLPPQNTLQCTMLCIVAFWILWMNWIITAVSDFTIMYTTELWYFNGGMDDDAHDVSPKVPKCAIARGWYFCVRYHLGSMALGGLVVGAAQPVRLTLAVLTSATRMENNALGGVLSCCCDCLVPLYENLLQPFCRGAYMDIGLNARSFAESAMHAQVVTDEQSEVVHILNGATWLFQLAGLGGITAFGELQTFLIIHWYPGFTDHLRPEYVQNPQFLTLCGAAVAFVVSFPFMMLFDTVSDTILFCYTVDMQRHHKRRQTFFEKIAKMARSCGPTGALSYLGDMASCHCGSRGKSEATPLAADGKANRAGPEQVEGTAPSRSRGSQ
eukprot:TRINITY_DN63321_c0_g1_i1.p1 TRINITY_DN63321_c0_g1~~TRINITY_DN63321_c0_g1_i1.p1  ORF type:complete len:757 (-),score=123.58 TRINITY_DN63321_c0_g1_i1:4-2274(-)